MIIEKITRIENVIESEELTTLTNCRVYSLIETEDKRIASGGGDGNISISSYNINEKIWKRDIHKKDAHIGKIYSLCVLSGKRLLSGSYRSIKIWIIFDVEITLIKELREHYNYLYKIIPLSKERFASCSDDCTVKIWKDNNTYECISTLKHNSQVKSILQLKGKDVLVSCGYSSSIGLFVWDINHYIHEHTIKGSCVSWSTHMIELSNGNIALSSNVQYYPIVIIDSSTYQVVTMIQMKKYFTSCSSLCVFNQHSFVYACNGKFFQISSEDGSILFQSKGGKFRGYYGGIIPIEKGNYFVIQNSRRISIVKLN